MEKHHYFHLENADKKLWYDIKRQALRNVLFRISDFVLRGLLGSDT